MALKTTIQFRRDHLSAWNEVNANTEGGLILKAGEIALVDLNNGNGAKNWVVRIGDGETPFDQLPETAYALSANVAAQIAEADANLSAGIGAVKSELTALIDGVEDKVDNKIKVGDATSVAAIDTLTIKRVNIEEYHNILTSETIDDNTLYVVSSDNLNAFGSRVVQVGDAEKEDDAVNLKQLNAVSASLYNQISAISEFAGGNVAEIISNVGEISGKVETIISATIPQLSETLGEEIDAVAADVATLSNTTIPGLEGEIDAVAADVATLSNTTIPGLEGEIDAVSSAVEGILTATIPGLEEEIAGLSTSLSAYEISVSTSTDDTNRLKSWTFTQGGTEIAKVEVPFDVFVDTGAVVEHDGETCLELTLKDGSVVHIPVNKLVDVYTGGQTDTISVTVGEDFVISAEVRDGSITTAKLADKAVTAAKIADKTITYAQIADGTITGAQISAETIAGTHIAAATIDQTKLSGEFIFDCGGAAG